MIKNQDLSDFFSYDNEEKSYNKNLTCMEAFYIFERIRTPLTTSMDINKFEEYEYALNEIEKNKRLIGNKKECLKSLLNLIDDASDLCRKEFAKQYRIF